MLDFPCSIFAISFCADQRRTLCCRAGLLAWLVYRKIVSIPTFLRIQYFLGESPCSQLSPEKKEISIIETQLSQVVTEILSFKVGHSILAFQKKNLYRVVFLTPPP